MRLAAACDSAAGLGAACFLSATASSSSSLLLSSSSSLLSSSSEASSLLSPGSWGPPKNRPVQEALEFVNSKEIQKKLTAEKGYAQQLVENKKPVAENVTDIFLRIYGRSPQAAELKIAVEFLEAEKDPAEAYRSLLWSLLATNEFLFNH